MPRAATEESPPDVVETLRSAHIVPTPEPTAQVRCVLPEGDRDNQNLLRAGEHRDTFVTDVSLLLYNARTGIIFHMLNRIYRILDILSILIVLVILGGSDKPRFTGTTDRTRIYTREIEFDYPNWVWDASWIKLEQAAINTPYIFTRGTNKRIVYEYFRTTRNLIQTEARIEQIYANPNIEDKDAASAFLRAQLDQLIERQKEIAPFAEAAIQSQVSEVLAEANLTAIGQPIPPVSYKISRTPLALIVSPRDKITQVASISVLPTLTINQQIELEDAVTESLDVSTLVVRIGGVGVYPTMVMETTDIPFTISTVAHEWAHNYLNIRPLGLNYGKTPELRTMNETTASIVGDEVGFLVLHRYYPELLASSPASTSLLPFAPLSETFNLILFNDHLLPSTRLNDPAPFDYRAEMHETRVRTDELLSQGKIEEAEQYMEQRRQILWENGYQIRKLNQAFFAFHGAYADQPGGAAGEDPVGPAVRALRAQSDSLEDFINTIAWMKSFEELQQAIQQ